MIMRFADISLAVFTLYGLSAGVCWLSASGPRPVTTKRAAPRDDKQSVFVCPLTGQPCEGDLAYLCKDYGCARKAGLSPHSAENL
jgi:hypothetical protein